jgi:hypothetical protein
VHQVAPRFQRPWPYRKPNIVVKVFIERTEINSHLSLKGLLSTCEYLSDKNKVSASLYRATTFLNSRGEMLRLGCQLPNPKVLDFEFRKTLFWVRVFRDVKL